MGFRRKKREKEKRRQERKAQIAAEVKAGLRPEPNMRQVVGWDEIVKESPAFETYYKAQKIIPESDWQTFMESLRSPLSASFRITSYFAGQSVIMKKLMQSDEFKDLISTSEETKESSPLACLDWYPNKLAYQLKCSRLDIKRSEALQRLHNFMISETEAGYISRQEAVSMIPPLVLDIKPNQKILDMCAAPGSKTAQIIEYLHDSDGYTDGVVVANEVDSKRCYMLIHQAKRLHSASCVITNHDAIHMPDLFENDDKGERQELKFDRVLCDVPCSGDGTLRKNTDIWKYWNPGHGNNFHGHQLKIARRGLELLKKNGLLAYSTCSLNPQEDEAVIATLLQEGAVELVDVADKVPGLKFIPGLTNWVVMNRELDVISSPTEIPEKNATQIRQSMFPPQNILDLHMERCVRILPHLQNTGGFFVAVLRKTEEKMPWETGEGNDASPTASVANTSHTEVEAKDRPTQKRKKYKRQRIEQGKGFKEDPFLFLNPDAPAWPEIRDFYKIHNDFPVEQLMYRSAEGKMRSFYFMTKSARQLILDNHENVKFVNAGARTFARNTDKSFDCSYRLAQEGLPSLFPFLDKDIMIKISLDDLVNILIYDNFPIENLADEAKERVQGMSIGSCIMLYESESKETGGKLVVPMCGWRGKGTLRPYISKHERVHFLRICGVDPKVLEEKNRQQFMERMERKTERLAKQLEKRNALSNGEASPNVDSRHDLQIEEKAKNVNE